MAKFAFGRFNIPVTLLNSPEEKYRVRVVKQENVDALTNSMMQFGSVNEHMEVVLFLPPNKPFPSKTGFKAPSTAEELQARSSEGFYNYRGAHPARDEFAAPALEEESCVDDAVCGCLRGAPQP